MNRDRGAAEIIDDLVPPTRERDQPAEQAAEDLSRFRVAGWDDERRRFTEPVEVRCDRCGTSVRLGEFAGGPDHGGAALDVVVAWARDHAC